MSTVQNLKNWGISYTLVVAIVVLNSFFFFRIQSYSKYGSDFTQDYVAATLARNGLPIYGESVSEAARMLGYSGIDNFHPPFLSILYMPITFIDHSVACSLFTSLGHVAFLLSLVFLLKDFGFNLHQRLLFLLIASAIYPSRECLYLAQISGYLAAAVNFGFVALRRGYPGVGGALFGFASSIKLFPLLLVFPLLTTRTRRAAFGMLLVFVGSWVLCLLLLGSDTIGQYFQVIAPRNIEEWTIFPANLSLAGFFRGLFEKGRWSRPLFEYPAFGSLLSTVSRIGLLLSFLWWLYKRKHREDIAQSLSVSIVTMLLISPLCWGHYLLLLALPIANFLSYAQTWKSPTMLVALILIALPTYDVAPLLGPVVGVDLLMLKLPIIGIFLVGYLATKSSSRSSYHGETY